MKDAKSRGGSTPDRFDKEVAVLVKYGVAKSEAIQIVNGRAELLMRQGLRSKPSATVKSEGNRTGGGGRSASTSKLSASKLTSSKKMK
jgi:hypothetical protein